MAQALHILLRETWEDGAGSITPPQWLWGGGRKQSPSWGWDTGFPSLASPGRGNRNNLGQNKKVRSITKYFSPPHCLPWDNNP